MPDSSLDKVFDPFIFNSTTDTELFLPDHAFDNVRDNCAFHLPLEVQNHITNSANKLNVIHINARSIVNKLDDLRLLLNETAVPWQIVVISETWISKSIEKNYNLPGYHAIFRDRAHGAGGGVAIYVADHLCPESLQCPEFTTAEVACANVKHNNNLNMAL